jgi:uncharacterized protein with PIN domain
MKDQGFIMDRYLSKVGNMLRNKGMNVRIVDTDDVNVVASQAAKEGRILLTSNLKAFNKLLSVPRGCLHFKASPFSKH